MTDSSTPCFTRPPERRRFLRRLSALAGGLVLGGWGVPLRAAEADIRSASLVLTDDLYVLHADIAAELGPLLGDVLMRGVSLFFVVEFQLTSPRWYWLDEEIANRTLTYRLSYQALTRQYRLSVGALHQNFATLDEALRTMLRVRNWGVLDRTAVKPGHSYNAAMRFRLDVAELPKPLQVSAFGRPDWNLSSDWLRWTFVPARDAK